MQINLRFSPSLMETQLELKIFQAQRIDHRSSLLDTEKSKKKPTMKRPFQSKEHFL